MSGTFVVALGLAGRAAAWFAVTWSWALSDRGREFAGLGITHKTSWTRESKIISEAEEEAKASGWSQQRNLVGLF